MKETTGSASCNKRKGNYREKRRDDDDEDDV